MDTDTQAIRLNIGAGNTRIDGFTPIDRKLGTEAYPLDYPDESVEEIRCCHMLEHLSFKDGQAALDDWIRVLKPGGRIKIAVPDFEKITNNGDPLWRFYLMGGQTDPDDFHRSVYDRKILQATMEQAGFVEVEPFEDDIKDDAKHKVSLNLTGVKPDTPIVQPSKAGTAVNICALMSCPRVGFMDSWGAISETLRPFKIPIRKATGAYWQQCMHVLLEDAVDDGIDWVLTLDYDTLCTPQNLSDLMCIFGQRPDIDALCGLQVGRRKDTPLMTIFGKKEAAIDYGKPLKVDTAHFGFTLIRVESLKQVPMPWMQDIAGEGGSWRRKNGPLDADISFWRKWAEHGKTVYCAPDVRVGHLEVKIAQFDQNMQAEEMYMHEWMDRYVHRDKDKGRND